MNIRLAARHREPWPHTSYMRGAGAKRSVTKLWLILEGREGKAITRSMMNISVFKDIFCMARISVWKNVKTQRKSVSGALAKSRKKKKKKKNYSASNGAISSACLKTIPTLRVTTEANEGVILWRIYYSCNLIIRRTNAYWRYLHSASCHLICHWISSGRDNALHRAKLRKRDKLRASSVT